MSKTEGDQPVRESYQVRPAQTPVAQKSIAGGTRPIAVFSLLAALFSIILLALLLASPAGGASQQLAFAASHTGLLTAFEFTVIVWATLSAPFVLGLGVLLEARSTVLARVAAGLSAVGILMLGFATYANTGALLAIHAAGAPPATNIDTYLATFWSQLGYLLTDPPLMAWGLGQLIFASLAWDGRMIPRWLAVIGGLAGLGIVLGSVETPSQAIFLIAFGILAFAVWSLGVGIVLLRVPRGSA